MNLQGFETPSSRNASTRTTTVPDILVPSTHPLMQAGSEAEARMTPAERMRYQLYLLDRSQRRPSIEDVAAALLECTTGEADA